MLLDLERRFCEIHIPRTAGIARARALVPWLSSHCCVDLIYRHWRAVAIREHIGPALWSGLYRYAVFRDPREIIESDYRLTVANLSKLLTVPERADALCGDDLVPAWRHRLEWLHGLPSGDRFGPFVRREHLGVITRGGFWRHYCLGRDGEDLGVDLIPYPELAARWPAICAKAGVYHSRPYGKPGHLCTCYTDPHPCPICYLPEINRAEGPAPEWPAELRAEVNEHFAGDLERLGIEPD